MDALLKYVSTRARQYALLTTDITSYSTVQVINSLSSGTTFAGSHTVADSTGRRIGFAAVSGMKMAAGGGGKSSSGWITHVAIVNDSSSKLLYITTCTSKKVTTGDTVTVPTWYINVKSPSTD
jgi:hypothetical protein